MLGNIHSIETFGSADGPGVRYLIFLKGCNMRCKYCHNPDTWAKTEGEMKSAEEILQQALRYKRYWGKKGGITVSGGEALLQIDFVTELFTLAKEKGVNTCLDTAGNPFTREKPFYSKFEKLMEVTDLFMLDIKEIDEDEHKQLTGQTIKIFWIWQPVCRITVKRCGFGTYLCRALPMMMGSYTGSVHLLIR